MIGIYKITNKVNGHIYIGQSVDIARRWYHHCYSSSHPSEHDHNSSLHKAIRKYGIEQFQIECIEELPNDKQLLNEREKYWIKYYNSYINGYNETIGGEMGNMQHGELHSKAKLTTQDVINIRTRYANLERCMVVYQDYADQIGRSGFNKIWKGETWKDIMPEVYTPERAEYHKNHTANPGDYNGRALLTDDQVLEIRHRFQKGEPLQEIYKDYQHTGITYRAFEYSARGYNRKYLNSKL